MLKNLDSLVLSLRNTNGKSTLCYENERFNLYASTVEDLYSYRIGILWFLEVGPNFSLRNTLNLFNILYQGLFETPENYSQEHVRGYVSLALWEENHVNHERILNI